MKCRPGRKQSSTRWGPSSQTFLHVLLVGWTLLWIIVGNDDQQLPYQGMAPDQIEAHLEAEAGTSRTVQFASNSNMGRQAGDLSAHAATWSCSSQRIGVTRSQPGRRRSFSTSALSFGRVVCSRRPYKSSRNFFPAPHSRGPAVRASRSRDIHCQSVVVA